MKTLKLNKITRNLTLIAASAFMATLVAVPFASSASAADVVFDEEGDPIRTRSQQPNLNVVDEYDEDGDPVITRSNRSNVTSIDFDDGDDD